MEAHLLQMVQEVMVPLEPEMVVMVQQHRVAIPVVVVVVQVLQETVVMHPGHFTAKMALHTVFGPVIEFVQQCGAYCARL